MSQPLAGGDPPDPRFSLTFPELVRRRAAQTPDKTAFEFLAGDGTEEVLSYAGLDARARGVAAALARYQADGRRALLMYPPGLGYVAAFLGCLYAGVVAVPVYPPAAGRGLDRILAVTRDARADFLLSDPATAAEVQARYPADELSGLTWLITGDGPDDGWQAPDLTPDGVAFLQYTSGSTGTPKGVVVRHRNLMHNAATIAGALGLGAGDRAVSWLPPYHDMGLIGGILQPLYGGFPCTLMSPLTFLFRPVSWLETMSRHRATATAAPDFGYLECVRRADAGETGRLDLSAWRHALVGAEPIRASTLDAFAAAFASAGFRPAAFYPCYGLAEATLLVTGATARQGARTLDVRRTRLEGGDAVPAPDRDRSRITLVSSGRPRGAEVLVVDPVARRRCPPGRVGELWVRGPGVTGEYWDSPAASAEAFGARLDGGSLEYLRTGDLAFAHEGDIFITGRIKDLIVIRGRNHYPHDIEETAGSAHPLALPGRTAAFAADVQGEERLILVQEVRPGARAADADAVEAALRTAIAAEHGLGLHELVLVRRGGVPRTTSGKIRRGECRRGWLSGSLPRIRPSGPPGPGPSAGRPRPPDVAAMTALAAEALATDSVPADIPLVALGLDSVRAVRLTAGIARSFGTEVPLDVILGGASVAGLAALVTMSGHADAVPPVSDAPAGTDASSAQTSMWLLGQLGAGAAYHIAGGVRLRGPLDPARLHDCLNRLIRDYDALRAVFTLADDGILRRTVRPPAPAEVPRLDLAAAPDAAARCQEALAQLGAEPFDLATGPLVRFLLIRLGDQDWRLGVALHHIIADGWSLGILLGRLGELYRDGGLEARDLAAGRPVPPASRPGDRAPGGSAPADLDGARPPALLADYRAGRGRSWRGGCFPAELGADLGARLREYAAAERVTPFMVLLTALAAVLARWTGQPDMLISVPAACRERGELLDQVGLFVNTLPIRTDLTGTPTFRQALARVADACLSAYRRQHVPYEHLARGGAPDGRDPLTRVMLALRSVPLRPWQAGGVQAEPFELPPGGAQFELSFHLADRADGALAGHVVYAADMLAEETARELFRAFTLLLDEALADDGQLVTDLPVLSPAGREHIVAGLSGAGVPPLAADLVHEEIERHAAASPAALAVLAPDRSLSYRELDGRANRLARLLAGRGAGPGAVVVVALPRCASLLVALLAVLKTGAAYLPADPRSPAARLARQLAASRPAAVVVAAGPGGDGIAGLAARLGAEAPAVVRIGDDSAPDDSAVGKRPQRAARPQDAANVIYTSGSTGHPKGVLTPHAALSNRLAWMQAAYPLRPGERVLHKTPLAFDVAGWELLWPLRAGATVVVAPPDVHSDPLRLARLITDRQITTCHFVPSMLRAFLDEPAAAGCRDTLRRVICSGEALPPELAERFGRVLPGVELHNLYGPAEAAIDVTAYPVLSRAAARAADAPGPRVPIGRPIAGARLYVLDDAGEPVPLSVPGELHIGGPVLARGYLNAPGQTAAAFVPDPFTPGGRLYRTGDLARWRADGELEFLGRRDHQVKIRGHRIEPAEVEAALAGHPAVHAVAVLTDTGPDGQPRLISYVAAGPGAVTPGELRDFAAARLPAAMVPASYVILDRLPTGSTGKLDRSALPAPAPMPAGPYVPPRTATERALGAMWCAVLETGQVSVRDDFFSLGGHSLLAARVVARIRAEFGVELPVSSLLDGEVTIEAVARTVESLQIAQADTDALRAALGRLQRMSDQEATELLTQHRRENAG